MNTYTYTQVENNGGWLSKASYMSKEKSDRNVFG